ncbi:hypothetical protein WR25_11408 [Diploscapter pachys]|uniref:GT23 domain-containing protein n=1 Tax=Diploscapter pachys TaxID=2018661 RepID=A0A2A2JRT1_9BILA|nr:hypothetical protein WR25_11408 [Diploscapter pachys]
MQWSMKSAAPSEDEAWREANEVLRNLKRQNEELKNLIETERKEHAERHKEEQESRKKLQNQLEIYAKDHNNEHRQVPAPKELPANSNIQPAPSNSNLQKFSKDYEITRRRLHSNIWEILYYIKKQYNELPQDFAHYYNHTQNQLYSLLGDSERLSEVDNSAEWRQAELQKLTDLIQKKIEEIQNPLDCAKSKALICNLDKECGFGCQMHHVAYCFLTAFATGRMLVLNSDGKSWRFSVIFDDLKEEVGPEV